MAQKIDARCYSVPPVEAYLEVLLIAAELVSYEVK